MQRKVTNIILLLFFLVEVLEPSDSFIRVYVLKPTCAISQTSHRVPTRAVASATALKHTAAITLNEIPSENDLTKSAVAHSSLEFRLAILAGLTSKISRQVMEPESPGEIVLERIDRPPIKIVLT